MSRSSDRIVNLCERLRPLGINSAVPPTSRPSAAELDEFLRLCTDDSPPAPGPQMSFRERGEQIRNTPAKAPFEAKSAVKQGKVAPCHAANTAQNRLIRANILRNAAKALGKPFPIFDEDAQHQIFDEWAGVLNRGDSRRIVDQSASDRAQADYQRFRDTGVFTPPGGNAA